MSSTRQFSLNPLCRALKKAALLGFMAAASLPVVGYAAEGTFLVQMKDYDGENAYFAMYLVDPEGRYVRTLWVSGDKKRWYEDMPRWWKYYGRAPQNLDAVTGASTAPGDRNVIRIHLDDKVLDAGYKVRIESAVEDKNNYPTDVETTLDAKHQKDKIPGTGYVRYFRYKWD